MGTTSNEMGRPENLEGAKLFDAERDVTPERKRKLLAWISEEGGLGGAIYTDPYAFTEEAAAIRELFPQETDAALMKIQFPQNRARIGPKNPMEQLEAEAGRRRDAPFARNLARLFPEALESAQDAVSFAELSTAVRGAWEDGDGGALAARLLEMRTLFPDVWKSAELETGTTVESSEAEIWNRMTEALNAKKTSDEWNEFAAQARAMGELFPERKNELGLMEPPVRDALLERRGTSTVFDANLAFLSR